MEVSSWKSLDLLVGGMLTAGVAFGVYKFGRLGRRAAVGGAAVVVSELDATNLQNCIALAGRPSELEVAVLPQPEVRCRKLAASLRRSMAESARRSASHSALIQGDRDPGNPHGKDLATTTPLPDPRSPRAFFSHLCAETKRELRDLFDMDRLGASRDQPSPPHPHFPRGDPYFSPLMVDRTHPELTRQLQAYRDTLDKWTADTEAKLQAYRDTLDKRTADTEAKMEKIEEQRMSLATELHVTREALQTERRHRAEAEQRRQRAEAQLQELEDRLQKNLEKKSHTVEREEEMHRLEQHVEDMEDQLELLYQHNVVTPRQAMTDNLVQHQQLVSSLEEAHTHLDTQQRELTEMENEVINLSTQLNKMRKDSRQLGEENTLLQKQLHGAHQVARQLVALLYERSVGQDRASPLTELLNAPDSDLPLDKLLEGISNLLQQQS
ncbi:hypothetical protein ACOMHN_035955 [Nucella lapillus]